eukprot:934127-Pyramimonas_sp.AAC.1
MLRTGGEPADHLGDKHLDYLAVSAWNGPIKTVANGMPSHSNALSSISQGIASASEKAPRSARRRRKDASTEWASQ